MLGGGFGKYEFAERIIASPFQFNVILQLPDNARQGILQLGEVLGEKVMSLEVEDFILHRIHLQFFFLIIRNGQADAGQGGTVGEDGFPFFLVGFSLREHCVFPVVMDGQGILRKLFPDIVRGGRMVSWDGCGIPQALRRQQREVFFRPCAPFPQADVELRIGIVQVILFQYVRVANRLIDMSGIPHGEVQCSSAG